jgi:divalent metal cation (Fe/Co/Zn/Cd) transporter
MVKNRAKKKLSSPKKSISKKSDCDGKHVEGDECYEYGYGVRQVRWKLIFGTIIFGLIFGIYLSGFKNISIDFVTQCLILIVGVITLGVLLDTRKIMINTYFKTKK